MIADKTKNCECEVCVHHREFKLMLETINNPIAKAWFEDFYGAYYEKDVELSCFKLYNDNLKRMYPKIWKEVTTMEYLDRDDAQFPEKQM